MVLVQPVLTLLVSGLGGLGMAKWLTGVGLHWEWDGLHY